MVQWMEERIMYRAYWGMEFNPFDKEISEKQFYKGTDFNEMMKRLEYLRNVRGIGLFTGLPGTGKTACQRTLVILIDEAQYLSRAILADLKLLMNFEMDSRNYAVLVLSGQPTLNHTLSMQVHEALQQRIVINYNMQGLTPQEVADYTRDRMKLCGASQEVFEASALEAAYGCCGGSIRRLNSLLHKALIIGCEQKNRTIGTGTIMDASNEIELI